MKLAALEKWSTVVRIVLPAKSASPVMKSKAMWDQEHPSIGKGWKSTNEDTYSLKHVLLLMWATNIVCVCVCRLLKVKS